MPSCRTPPRAPASLVSAVNRDDGSVAIRLEGDPAAVAQVERAAERGPDGARVASVDARDAEPEGLTRFRVA